MTAKEILQQLNSLDEHHAIEAKRASAIDKSFLETVCAFSNEPDLGGGHILLGVERNETELFPTYSVVGVENPDVLSNTISSQCASSFNIPVRPQIITELLHGKPVLVVHVPEMQAPNKPVYLKNLGLPRGAYRRIGSSDQHCTEDDLPVFYKQKSGQTVDGSVVAEATMADIDQEAIEFYRKARAKVNAAAEELQWSDEELLVSLTAARSEAGILRPTVAGILLFGTRQALRRLFPMLRVDYIRVPGHEWVADPGNRFTTVDMRGPLLQMVQRAQDAVVDDLPKGFVLPEGQAQAETPQLSSRVLREAIVNAIMHRSYHVNGPIEIIRYTNRIEIVNPGYSLKADDRLGEPGSETRNPHIAAVFHETNFAETKGSGIRTMRRLMEASGFAPPTFESDRVGNRFVTRLLLHHFLNPADIKWLAQFVDVDLSDAQRRGLVFLREAGALDNAAYRQLNGADTLTASQELRKLRQAKLIEKKGQGSATYYVPGLRLQKALVDWQPGGAGTGVQTGKVHHLTGVQMGKVRDLPEALFARLPSRGKNLKHDQTREIIRDLCAWKPFRAKDLAELLGRGEKYLLRKHLSPMIDAKELEYTFPDMVNHPQQAYRSPTGRKEGGDR